MDSLATTLLFAVILLGQVRLFCGVILRKCVNIHTTLSDIVILPPWVILLTYIILRVRVFSSTVVTKNNGNNFLTLEQLHTFFNLFFFKLWFYSPILFTMDMISVLTRKSLVRGPQTSKNSLGLVKICDGLVKFKYVYRETRIWN